MNGVFTQFDERKGSQISHGLRNDPRTVNTVFSVLRHGHKSRFFAFAQDEQPSRCLAMAAHFAPYLAYISSINPL